MCNQQTLQTNNNRHKKSKQDKRKFGCYIAALLLIALPIAQLNVFAFTNGVPVNKAVEKLSASTLAGFLGDDPWSNLSTQGDGPSKIASKQETPAQSTDEGKQDEKKDDENKEKNEDSDKESAEKNDEKKETSIQKSDAEKQANTNSNSNSGSGNSGSNNNASNNSNSNSNTNNNSSEQKQEKKGHWEQKLVKEAWTENVTVTKYRCMCGQIFDSTAAWQAHRPNP